jgi:ornithine carbamoyltransferase
MKRDLLEIDDLTPTELQEVLELSTASDLPQMLDGQGAALVFEKPSARTRNSMEMAVVQLGGHPVTIRSDEVGIDKRESAEDVARTLACYHAVLAARVFQHATVERMAAAVDMPVVNMLSDEAHPLQALADLLTIRSEFGAVTDRSVAYIGDANNVARSLALGVGMCGGSFRIASPPGYQFSAVDMDRIRATGIEPLVTEDVDEAVSGADVIYTDVWTSMGQEEEVAARRDAFAGYRIDETLLAKAAGSGVLLHCLPAHRGEEVSAAAIDGSASRVWAQAENRMHSARGLLAWILQQ